MRDGLRGNAPVLDEDFVAPPDQRSVGRWGLIRWPEGRTTRGPGPNHCGPGLAGSGEGLGDSGEGLAGSGEGPTDCGPGLSNRGPGLSNCGPFLNDCEQVNRNWLTVTPETRS